MEDNKEPEKTEENPLDSGESLDGADTQVASDSEPTTEPTVEQSAKAKDKLTPGNIFKKIALRINIYLLVFVLLVVIVLIIIFVVLQASNKESQKADSITSQELTQEAVESLTSNESTVGDPKQLLTIESNAVFSGKVLIRDGLDVAGPIKVGGDLSLPGITVSGKSAFDEVQLNSLSIAGDASVQGSLTVQNNISVTGQASFGGAISAPSITIDALQLTGDIQFNGHIDAGGGSPSVVGGSATGSGGTVTISGTDTAGTVTVNIGSGSAAGVIANVTFASSFNGNPHVVITPIASLGSGPVSGTQKIYLSSRTTAGFSIATNGSLSAGSISFDFIVID